MFKVGPRPKNTIFGPVFATILAVLKGTGNLAYVFIPKGETNRTSNYQKEKSNKMSYIISWFVMEMRFTALKIHLGSQQLLRGSFPSKIYIQFTIFNTYFSTKLLFTNKRYHLHMLEKYLYVLQEVINYIFSTVYSSSFYSFMSQWNKLCFHVLYHGTGEIL